MKKITLFTIFVVFSNFIIAETKEDFKKDLKSLNDKFVVIQKENANLKKSMISIEASHNVVKKELSDLKQQLATTNSEMNTKVSTVEANTNDKIKTIDDSISKSSLWTIIGILFLALISAFVYFFLSKRQKNDKSDLIEKVNQTRTSIEESFVSELSKQTSLMEEQVKLIEAQKNSSNNNETKEIDHSLALKVADEITLIERNISLMDANVKGLKQLTRSVEKLRDNLNANGYEIPVLLGQNYHQGMKVVVVSSIPDENLDKEVEIITKIIKPQVNYNEKMIQTAQIEVSVGY